MTPEEIKKVVKFFEEEFGINKIMLINATPEEFVIETYVKGLEE